MTGIVSTLLDLSVIVFAASSMLSVGFRYGVRQIIGPLRHVGAVLRAVAANFVLVPLLAYLVLQFIALDPPRAIGLFLIASAAGAPFLIKLVEAAESDVSLSASLLVLLLPITIIYMPIVVPLALPAVEVSAGTIAMPLVVTMLLPLAVGLLVREGAADWAARLQPIMQVTSTVALIVLIASLILVNFEGILNVFDLDAIAATTIIIGGAFAIGFLLGGTIRGSREVLGLGTGQRNIAAATVVAAQVIGNPDTLAMVVVASLLALAILFGLTLVLRRQEERDQASPGAGRRRAA